MDPMSRAERKISLDKLVERETMSSMQRDERVTIRLTGRERAKVAECAQLMAVSEGEFIRRSVQVMLMVMGDEESRAVIHGILDAATIMGAGLPPVPPTNGVTRTPPVTPRRGRKGKEGR
jgi:hypothetical protein